MNKVDRFLLSSVLVALCVNLASGYIGRSNLYIEKYISYALIACLSSWSVIFLCRILYKYFTDGKFAVEAFILNKDKELLLYRHVFHNKFIPPGGRVNNQEFPDIALVNRLRERVGLNDKDYKFNNIIHSDFNKTNYHTSFVHRLPVPFVIQKEIRKQRLFKKFHYDFIYVLDLIDDNFVFPNNIYCPFKFVTMEILNKMVDTGDTFPDVADTYHRILSILNK